MTVYVETSAVLRWLFAEAEADEVRSLLAGASARAADILSVFAQASSTWAILEISEDVARRAEEAFPAEPVRSLDAIHLASALFLRQSFPDLVVATVDSRVRANSEQLGFEVQSSRS